MTYLATQFDDVSPKLRHNWYSWNFITS